MRELIGKLEVVDDATASALRVIDHFDRLVEQRAPVAAVVRAAAALAGCPAGVHDAGRGLTRRYGPDGQALPPNESHRWARVPVPGQPGSWAWLERTGADRPLDALILERTTRAIQTLAGDTAHRSTGAAVRIACDPDAAETDRRDAAARLGLTGPVTVVVSASTEPPAPRSTTIGRHLLTLYPGTPVLPPNLRAGTATAPEPTQLPTAAQQARIALKLADSVGGLGSCLVRYDQLGALALVAERITAHEAAANADVRRLDEVQATHPRVIDTLQAVLDQTSLRQAASNLHVHHSTLQERLAWLATQLGYSLAQPGGRQRASVAVLLWRIAHSGDESLPSDS